MRKRIIDFLDRHEGKKFTINQLSKEMNLESSEDYKNLAKTINELEEEAVVMPNEKNKYTLIKYTPYYTGVLDLKQKGFAFLMLDDSDEDDIYIPAKKTKDAMNRDRVLAYVERSPKGFKKEGEVIRILERRHTHIVGTVVKRNNRYYLDSDEKGIKASISIKEKHLNGAEEKDKVKCEIISYDFKDMILCKVSEIIGKMSEKGVDIMSKILRHDIDPEFPPQVLEEAAKFKELEKDYGDRRDLRDRLIFTIDGEDAKDFDDAVEVYEKEDGTYHLGVHIADVSHYVQEDSILDKEAYERGTSIYLVDRVIPMLPENLSNNLCSLMPDVDRFALSCEMIIDKEGRVKSHEIFPSVIKSKARMTYTKVNKILDGDEALKKQYDFLEDTIFEMKKLADILHERRTKVGSINFDTDEAYITLDENGKAVNVSLLDRGKSERIIEEFMLIANQTVAKHVFWMELPFIYRIHEEPDEQKIEQLLTIANALGFKVKSKKKITHQALQKLLQKVEDTASEKGINMLMLRSMQKAVYSKTNVGHFGLAFSHYTHFTSPIRRYPDLIVHRLLREYFFKKNATKETTDHYDSVMGDIATQSSARERNAITLERDVTDMKKCEYMADKVGETFEGHISSITNFGLYVALPNTVEGLVHISALDDDYYVFDEDLLNLIGRRKKKVYRIGETIKVKLESVNIFEGEIDFTIPGGD